MLAESKKGIRVGAVIISSDSRRPIHKDQARCMFGIVPPAMVGQCRGGSNEADEGMPEALRRLPLGVTDVETKAFSHELIDRVPISGQEEPALGVGPKPSGIACQHRECIVLWIEGDGDQADPVDSREVCLELGHGRCQEGAGVCAIREDEAGDPDLAVQIG